MNNRVFKRFKKNFSKFLSKRTPLFKRIRKNWKRIIGVAVLLLVALLIFKRVTSIPKGITTSKVERTTLVDAFSVNGNVKAKKSVDLKFNLPSKVVWVGVKKGDSVRAYQAVAALDARQLQKALENSLSLYKTARWNFEQVNDDNDVQGRELDQILFDKTIRRLIDQSQFSLDRSVLDVQIKDIALKEAALVTPIAGTVVETNDLVAGINLSGADIESKFIKVTDLTSLYFSAKVDEVDFGKVNNGQEVSVSFDAYPGQKCDGTVSYVSSAGETSTGGVVTIPVEVTLSDCKLNLALGLNGQADFVLSKKEDVLTIQKKYLVVKNGENFVWLQTGKTVRNRKLVPVKLGTTTLTEAEVTEGLTEGETVIYIPQS